MKFEGFCGPSYVAKSPIMDNERSINCYVEHPESPNATTKMALIQTPGRKKLATAAEVRMPFDFTVNGRTFFAASNLYELHADSTLTNLGSIGAVPVKPTMMCANETQLVILNNGNLYVFTLATNTLVAVNMGQFNGPVAQIKSVDGFIIATLQNSHTFQQSNLEDATTWSGLNIATISYFPDNIVSMELDERYVRFFSAKKMVAYFNSGAGFPVFIPVQGDYLQIGSGAEFGAIEAGDDVLWLTQNEGGVMEARSLRKGRVSTHAMEQIWQSFTVNSDAVAWWYQDGGHTFVNWYFPTANRVFTYDSSESEIAGIPLWHERAYFQTQNGQYIADRAMCHTENFGKHIVGDWASGNIYELNSNYTTDDGNPIRGNRRSPTLIDENKRVSYSQIEFLLQTGTAPDPPLLDGLGNPRPFQLMLRWSDDGGKTWSNWYFLSCGFAGQYNVRVIKRMLGRGRKRIWDVAWIDPVLPITDAFLEMEPEA